MNSRQPYLVRHRSWWSRPIVRNRLLVNPIVFSDNFIAATWFTDNCEVLGVIRKMSKKKLLAVALALLFLILVAAPTIQHTLLLAQAKMYGQQYLGRQVCNELIFIYSTNYFAQNCQTASLDSTDTAPQTVINTAIATLSTGGKIVIVNGTYTLTAPAINLRGGNYAAIGSTTISNVDLGGFGNSTILRAGTNLNAAIIGLTGVNGWHIHDLQIDGNRASQSAVGTTPQLDGIETYYGTDIVIERCYIHDTKTFGINTWDGTAFRIVNNYVVNNNANGIQVYTGSSYVVQGNVVDGASDVGISISGDSGTSTTITDVVCSNNIVKDVNLSVSPFGLNTGNGILIGDNGPASRVSVAFNVVEAVSSVGIQSYPSGSTKNTDVVIEGNLIYDIPVGVYIGPTIGATVDGNIIHNVHSTVSGTSCIYIESDAMIISIKGNTIETETTPDGVGIFNNSNDAIISSNTINETAYTGIVISSSNSIISNNELDRTDIQSTSYVPGGILLEGTSSYNLVSSNTILLHNVNDYSIELLSTASYNMIINNMLLDGSSGMIVVSGAACVGDQIIGNNLLGGSGYFSSFIIDTGTSTRILNNAGYNPQGFNIATPTVPASGVFVTNTFGFPVRICILTPGTTTAYTILDPSGSAVTVTATLFAGMEITLDPGAKIQFAYRSAPTWRWYGT